MSPSFFLRCCLHVAVMVSGFAKDDLGWSPCPYLPLISAAISHSPAASPSLSGTTSRSGMERDGGTKGGQDIQMLLLVLLVPFSAFAVEKGR